MHYSNNPRGFTFIELIVVIAILAIVAAIAVPTFHNVIELSKMNADQATVSTLNKATHLMRLNTSEQDPFKDSSKNAQALLESLVTSGYLRSVVEPQSKNAAFTWLFDDEIWYLFLGHSYYVVTGSDGFTITNGRLQGSYSGQLKNISIPASIDGENIKDIFQETFMGKGLIAVDFDDNSILKIIHARAFKDNILTTIDLPDSITEIHTAAFLDNKLAEIKLSNNLQLIESHAFKNNNLTEIKLPDTLTSIRGYAFENNKTLNKITIGPNVASIGVGAFNNNGSSDPRTTSFDTAYRDGGAGTYIWGGVDWVKQ